MRLACEKSATALATTTCVSMHAAWAAVVVSAAADGNVKEFEQL
jgi:hypothetical protein